MSNNITRDYLLDTFRGLMLILMTIDHSPLFFFKYTFQPLGTFSAAEGFFYLSGFVFGMVYSKYLSDPGKLWLKAWERIKIMYKYHVLIFIILLLEQVILQYFNKIVTYPMVPPDANMLKYIVKFLLFLKFPLYFNIIPVYIFFFLLGPILLFGFHKNKEYLILGISIGLWIISNISETMGFNDVIFGNRLINEELRIFNPFSWQLIFVIGSFFGYRRSISKKLKFNKILLIVSLLYCLFFLILRRSAYLSNILSLQYLFNEGTRMVLAPLRLINFFAFVYIISYLLKGKLLNHRNYLSFIGSYSIYVFIFQIFLVHQLKNLSNDVQGLSVVYQILIAFLIIWSLTIPAILKEWHKLKKINKLPVSQKLWFLFPKNIYEIIMHIFRFKFLIPNNSYENH